jgi:DNA-directed RNA polymerase subunit F
MLCSSKDLQTLLAQMESGNFDEAFLEKLADLTPEQKDELAEILLKREQSIFSDR